MRSTIRIFIKNRKKVLNTYKTMMENLEIQDFKPGTFLYLNARAPSKQLGAFHYITDNIWQLLITSYY